MAVLRVLSLFAVVLTIYQDDKSADLPDTEKSSINILNGRLDTSAGDAVESRCFLVDAFERKPDQRGAHNLRLRDVLSIER